MAAQLVPWSPLPPAPQIVDSSPITARSYFRITLPAKKAKMIEISQPTQEDHHRRTSTTWQMYTSLSMKFWGTKHTIGYPVAKGALYSMPSRGALCSRKSGVSAVKFFFVAKRHDVVCVQIHVNKMPGWYNIFGWLQQLANFFVIGRGSEGCSSCASLAVARDNDPKESMCVQHVSRRMSLVHWIDFACRPCFRHIMGAEDILLYVNN